MPYEAIPARPQMVVRIDEALIAYLEDRAKRNRRGKSAELEIVLEEARQREEAA